MDLNDVPSEFDETHPESYDPSPRDFQGDRRSRGGVKEYRNITYSYQAGIAAYCLLLSYIHQEYSTRYGSLTQYVFEYQGY